MAASHVEDARSDQPLHEDDDDHEDEYEMVMGVKLYPDGRVDRSNHNALFPIARPSPLSPTLGALSKDVLIPTSTGTSWVRLYLPHSSAATASYDIHDQPTRRDMHLSRLPIILYIHGGGFVITTAATAHTHEYCCTIAAKLGLLVVSVEYRLAPEHRLPAAFKDALSALKWLQAQSRICYINADDDEATVHSDIVPDPWLSAHGDFGKCFIMGHSAGATIVHHIAVLKCMEDYNPLKIRGLVMAIPFFGGLERTDSETKYADTDFLTLKMTDAFWAASLPLGSDRSHPFCNFQLSFQTQDGLLKGMRLLPPVLVVVGGKDLLHDRQLQYVRMLEELAAAGERESKVVKLVEYEEYGHYIFYPEVSREEDVEEAYSTLQHFMSESCAHVITANDHF